jgi:hypothetical protein
VTAQPTYHVLISSAKHPSARPLRKKINVRDIKWAEYESVA